MSDLVFGLIAAVIFAEMGCQVTRQRCKDALPELRSSGARIGGLLSAIVAGVILLFAVQNGVVAAAVSLMAFILLLTCVVAYPYENNDNP